MQQCLKPICMLWRKGRGKTGRSLQMLRRYPRLHPRSRRKRPRKNPRKNPQGPSRKALAGLTTVLSVVYSQTNLSVVKISSSVFILVVSGRWSLWIHLYRAVLSILAFLKMRFEVNLSRHSVFLIGIKGKTSSLNSRSDHWILVLFAMVHWYFDRVLVLFGIVHWCCQDSGPIRNG